MIEELQFRELGQDLADPIGAAGGPLHTAKLGEKNLAKEMACEIGAKIGGVRRMPVDDPETAKGIFDDDRETCLRR
ncbi:MAG TPA: hypothetical protein VH022_14370 [Candidatus Acidoferrum sp.]|nr:hypothetical protein [Candidatus Acidoferrum sp.]